MRRKTKRQQFLTLFSCWFFIRFNKSSIYIFNYIDKSTLKGKKEPRLLLQTLDRHNQA